MLLASKARQVRLIISAPVTVRDEPELFNRVNLRTLGEDDHANAILIGLCFGCHIKDLP
jgi:hypothetical protein